jgi:glyoxylase-like metal-dependent hydrolase (beta-lactamase superfamily II)
MTSFVELASGVFVLRYPTLDVNCTLIVGDEVAAVVDTLATQRQARELIDALRRVTHLPLTVINTHAHFDHCFGNALLAQESPSLSIWGHQSTMEALRDHGALVRRVAYDEALALAPDIADDVLAATLLAPDRAVQTISTMDIGHRIIELHHFGRAHTEGDIVVNIPDASVVVAGDLVEEGGPPSFADSYPLEWPETLTALLALGPQVIVPGHGAVVDAEFVHRQHDDLTRLEWLIRDGHADGASVEEVAANAPYGPDAARVAARRGYAELSGRL